MPRQVLVQNLVLGHLALGKTSELEARWSWQKWAYDEEGIDLPFISVRILVLRLDPLFS